MTAKHEQTKVPDDILAEQRARIESEANLQFGGDGLLGEIADIVKMQNRIATIPPSHSMQLAGSLVDKRTDLHIHKGHFTARGCLYVATYEFDGLVYGIEVYPIRTFKEAE